MEIQHFIGKGSYGSVSLGVRQSDGEVFAVKSAEKTSLHSITALENEIDILRSLSSPFIVQYYGNEETQENKSIYLEYVPTGDISKGGKVSDVELIRSYTWCLVMGLKTIHDNGIVHCDVKGSNVLVTPTTGVAKIADFGSAKRVDKHAGVRQIVSRGSPLWMAPEVVRGEWQGIEADVWSLGCTVLEMFTGVPAWKDNGAHTLLQIGYSNDLPEFPANLPELGRDFLLKCLSRDPASRWSCDELLDHPFLLPVREVREASPRSVFDWSNMSFSDDDEDEVVEEEVVEFDEVSVAGRIGKLATSGGVNWESDGWVEVRAMRQEDVKEEEEEEILEGVNSEYSILGGVNLENEMLVSSNLVGVDEIISRGVNGCNEWCDDLAGPSWMKCGQSDCNCCCCCEVKRDKVVDVTTVNIGVLFLLFLLYSSINIGHNSNKKVRDFIHILVHDHFCKD